MYEMQLRLDYRGRILVMCEKDEEKNSYFN